VIETLVQELSAISKLETERTDKTTNSEGGGTDKTINSGGAEGFFHIGGDELHWDCWDVPHINAWMAQAGTYSTYFSTDFSFECAWLAFV
jgi:hypothetical protein